MAQTATATVQMDKRGRCYIPKAAREKLGIEGESANVEIEVRVDE